MLLCALLFSLTANAANVPDLYQAAVPVSDRSAASRQEAVKDALKVVLVKVSGNTNVASVPAVAGRLSQAQALLQQYRYLVPSDTPLGITGLQLQVQFDPTGVNQLLQATGQAVWPNNRPRLGVWLFVEGLDNQTRAITKNMGSEDPLAAMPFLLMQDASDRGVPIVLPTQSMIKANAIDIDDADRLSNTTLRPVLTALNADGLLIGRIVQIDSQTWQSHWVFILGEDTMQWQSSNTDLSTLFSGVFTNVADNLTQQFAVLPDDQNANRVLLSVDHIDSAADFSRVMHYLKQLSLVGQIQVVRVDHQNLVVALQTNGGEQALRQALQFGHVLIPAPQGAGDAPEMIRYQIAQ